MAEENPPARRRFSVSLDPTADEALEELMRMKRKSQNDTVNWALQAQAIIERELVTGKELLLRDLNTGELVKVHIV